MSDKLPGEWTAESVFTLYGHPNNVDGWQIVADAHNAAFAAESDVWRRQATEIVESLAAERERKLQQQLAAERHWLGELLAIIHGDGGHYQSEHGTEKATKDAIAVRTGMVLRIDELETQLAAERNERRIRTAQLAAEREKHGRDLAQSIERTLDLEAEKFALSQQLAAERETHIRNSNRKTHTIEELTKRLEEGESVWKRDAERILELSKQLATEREKR